MLDSRNKENNSRKQRMKNQITLDAHCTTVYFYNSSSLLVKLVYHFLFVFIVEISQSIITNTVPFYNIDIGGVFIIF